MHVLICLCVRTGLHRILFHVSQSSPPFICLLLYVLHICLTVCLMPLAIVPLVPLPELIKSLKESMTRRPAGDHPFLASCLELAQIH